MHGRLSYHEAKEILEEHGPRFDHSILDKHCTGSSKSALISEDDYGIRIHCFRCGVNFLAPRPSSGHLRLNKQTGVPVKDLTQGYRYVYPTGEQDFLQWPASVRDWALRYVNTRTLSTSMARWDWDMQRLWLPVLLEGRPVRWSGRNFGQPDRPKYLSGRVKDYAYHDSFGQDGPVCITECILGALRIVQDAQTRAYPLLGTGLTEIAAHRLAQETDRVIVWLDNDNSQVMRARRKLVRQLQGHNLQVAVYRGRFDPKREPDLTGCIRDLTKSSS